MFDVCGRPLLCGVYEVCFLCLTNMMAKFQRLRMIINKVVLIILLKVQQGKGKIVKNYGYLWWLMKTKKRHKVYFTKRFNFQKQEIYFYF